MGSDAMTYIPSSIEIGSVIQKLLLRIHKGVISGPSARRTKDLLKLNGDQLRWVVGLFTRHCHLKGHLFKLGLTNNPTCERCLDKDESFTHVLCDCGATAYITQDITLLPM
jgi:hypothetical protein